MSACWFRLYRTKRPSKIDFTLTSSPHGGNKANHFSASWVGGETQPQRLLPVPAGTSWRPRHSSHDHAQTTCQRPRPGRSEFVKGHVRNKAQPGWAGPDDPTTEYLSRQYGLNSLLCCTKVPVGSLTRIIHLRLVNQSILLPTQSVAGVADSLIITSYHNRGDC